MAIAAAGMAGPASSGTPCSSATGRRNCLFTRHQFAIPRFVLHAHAGAISVVIPALEELLKDRVFHDGPPSPQAVRDPITAPTDWGLIAAPGGGIMGGLQQIGAAPLKRAEFDAPNRPFEDRAKQLGEKLAYKDWQFVYIGPGGRPRADGPGSPEVRAMMAVLPSACRACVPDRRRTASRLWL